MAAIVPPNATPVFGNPPSSDSSDSACVPSLLPSLVSSTDLPVSSDSS